LAATTIAPICAWFGAAVFCIALCACATAGGQRALGVTTNDLHVEPTVWSRSTRGVMAGIEAKNGLRLLLYC